MQKAREHLTKSDRKNLLLVRCGAESLHPSWHLKKERNYDLVALAYDNTEFSDEHQDLIEYIEGPKIAGIHEWLERNTWVFAKYSFLGIFDDDISTNCKDICKIFEYATALNTCIAQPSLSEESYYGVMITRQHKSFLHRWTNWVEVMAPVFKTSFLQSILPTFPLSPYGGCCLEALWSSLCKQIPGDLAIIDSISITHTRPMGSAGSGDISSTNQLSAHHRRRLLMAQTGIMASIDNISGLTRGGDFLHLGQHEFIQLISNDILDRGLPLHPLTNERGLAISTKAIHSHYIDRLTFNYEAMQNNGANSAFLESLACAAIHAGQLYSSLINL